MIAELGVIGTGAAVLAGAMSACTRDAAPPGVWTGPNAFVDFSSKPDGAPPSVLDSGQPVDSVLESRSGRQPQIANGMLVHGELPQSGSYADYFQARIGDECHSFGASWTVDAGDGSTTPGVVCLAVWADVFEADGGPIPRTPGHITIDTISGQWQWWVGDGGARGGDTNLTVAKKGYFTAPSADGRTVWECAVKLDSVAGRAYAFLPGVDMVTGSRFVALTNSEIADALAARGLPETTFVDLNRDASVLMIEHYADSEAPTARYPRFLTMWADTLPANPGRGWPAATEPWYE